MISASSSILAEREPAEVRLRVGHAEPERAQPLVHRDALGDRARDASSTASWWASASTAAACASGVAEERLAHLVERARQLLRAAQREADAQPAEAVDLGEGAQQHEVGVASSSSSDASGSSSRLNSQ